MIRYNFGSIHKIQYFPEGNHIRGDTPMQVSTCEPKANPARAVALMQQGQRVQK